jgi:hypothetical protein
MRLRLLHTKTAAAAASTAVTADRHTSSDACREVRAAARVYTIHAAAATD